MIEFVNREGTGCSKWDSLEAKFGLDGILPLWVADMDLAAPKVAQDAIAKRAAHAVYGYSIYTDKFYQAIIDWYSSQFDWEIQREWIVPEHGVVISLNLSIQAFTSIGDGIIVQTPIYPPFLSSIQNHGREVLENRLIFKDGLVSIDFDDFEAKAKEAKLFLLCSPHNPSTRVWSRDELEKMISICHENSVVVIADEIHSDLVFGSAHTPIGKLSKARDITLTLHAPSKTFNIAGLNTSYLIIPNEKLREAYVKEHKKAGLDNGNPFGIVASEAVYNGGVEWLAELKTYLIKNSKFISSFIGEKIPEIIVYEHQATFLIWLDCRGLGLDDKELTEFFIHKAGLGLNAGISFGEAGSGFMRLNIGTSMSILEEAMNKLESAVKVIRK